MQGGINVLIDYGKRAYIKLNELEKRLISLEKKLEKSAYTTLFFDLTTDESRNSFIKNVKFLSKGDSVVKAELFITLGSLVYLNYQVKLNGKIIKSGTTSTLESVIAFDVGSIEGENSLELSLSSSTNFKFDNLKLTLGGQVEYYLQKRKLSLSTTTYSDYIIYQNGDLATLYYYADGNLSKVIDYNEVFDVSLLGFDGIKLYIGIVNKLNELKIEALDVYGERECSITLDKNVSSVCGYLNENGVTVIYSKAGDILMANYQSNGSFFSEKTGRRGALVTCDSDAYQVYVVYGDYKPTKLVDYFATYVLDKGENYHVIKTDGGYIVRYALDGRLYEQEVTNVTKKSINLSSCDEILRLNDGKYIKRVRDVLSVGKEEDV